MIDKQTISVYDDQIEAYTKLTERNVPALSLESFIKTIPKNGYVLDLGCGPAEASAVIRERSLRVDPVDASAEMVKFANDKFSINARQAVFADIDAVDVYDGVWANFSLLHAPREEFPAHLASLHKALKSGGRIHLGMKLGEGSGRDKLGRFYTYYSESELTDYLVDAGFSVDDISHGEDLSLAGKMEPWIILAGHSQKS